MNTPTFKLFLTSCLLSACSSTSLTALPPTAGPAPQNHPVQVNPKPQTLASPNPSSAPTGKTAAPVGKATLKGEIVIADLLKVSAWALQQNPFRQFGVRVLMQACDDLLAEVETDREFNIANLPENVPLDVDIHAKNNPLLQLRAQVILTDTETVLRIDASSTALALLRLYLSQIQSPAFEIPNSNYVQDSELARILADLTSILRGQLGQETLRSLEYQTDWNSSLATTRQTLEALIQARPELLSLLEPPPAGQLLPVSTGNGLPDPDNGGGSSGDSGGGGSSGGGSSSSSGETFDGGNSTVTLEGL